MYRSISSRSLWEAAYALIIAGEGATALGFVRRLCCCATCVHPPRASIVPKDLLAVAASLGFLVWFFGFMVIGGEWFQMWQSSQWNGQQPAFRFYLTILERGMPV